MGEGSGSLAWRGYRLQTHRVAEDRDQAGVLRAVMSTALRWRSLPGFVASERRVALQASRHSFTAISHEFVRFGVKQGWACLFGGIMVALLLATHRWYPADAFLSRYDFLTIAALAVQAGMLLTGLETWEEAKVILLFHLAGTVMEVFKTAAGSWMYPHQAREWSPVGMAKLGAWFLLMSISYSLVASVNGIKRYRPAVGAGDLR